MKNFNVYQRREIERMEQYQKPNAYPPSQQASRLVYALLLGIVIAGILASFVGPVSAAPEDHWLCRVVKAAYYGPEVSIGEWDGFIYGWTNIPFEVFEEEPIILYTDELMTSGYVLYHYGDKMYVFPHYSFLRRADSNGNRTGTHDFCDVIIYDLSGDP